MAHPSTTKTVTATAPCEECWVLVGMRRGRIWQARRLPPTRGTPARVAFDGAAVLAREERRGDVVGFLHTHPNCPARPSERDLATMRAWVSAFGKPLLCLIAGSDGLRGYCFESDESVGNELTAVETFPRGVIVAVAHAS